MWLFVLRGIAVAWFCHLSLFAGVGGRGGPGKGALVPGFVAGDSVESGEKAEAMEGGAVEEVGFGLRNGQFPVC